MNTIEKFAYDILKHNPKLKIFVRNMYQSIMDIFPKRKIVTKNELHVNANMFFGFHDINPFNKDNTLVLANQYFNNLTYPSDKDILEVGFVDLKTWGFNKLGESKTWNFHKGCRLQWKNTETIIYNNSFENGCYTSKEINVTTRAEITHRFPIDSVSNNGEYCSSFSYGRLQYLMPGYGYLHLDKESYLSENFTESTGIKIIHISSEKTAHYVSLKKIVNLLNLENYSKEYFFYVTHSLFSADDKNLSFLVRWTAPNNTLKRFSRLIVYNIEKGTLSILPTDEMVSHYVWKDKDNLLAYARVNSIDGHYLFEKRGDHFHVKQKLKGLNSDGHQSFGEDGKLVIDTYPNAKRIQKLFFFDNLDSKPTEIGKFYHPKSFQSSFKKGHICVDLHPRMSSDGKLISFDSAFDGNRNLCVMKIKF